MKRPSMNGVLMGAALLIAERGTCPRLKTGALIADSRGRIRSWGYNGTLSGMAHCDHPADDKPCTQAEHAERNAIFDAARNGIAVGGQRMYTTHAPCLECARAIIQAGIVHVYYNQAYRLTDGLDLLQAAEVKITKHRVL